MRALMRDILDGMRAQPGRLALAFLAVMTGMIALTVQRALSGGLELRARQLVDELGAHVVAVVARQVPEREGEPGLRATHAALLDANLRGRPVSLYRGDRVSVEGDTEPVRVLATDDRLAGIRRWSISAGRFLDPEDLRTGARVAVVSEAYASRRSIHPGSILLIQQMPFTVAGIIRTGSGGAADASDVARIQPGAESIFVPWTAPLPWILRASRDSLAVDVIFAGGRTDDDPGRLAAQCGALLAAPGLDPGGFDLLTPETLVEGLRRLQRALRWSAGGIALLCLLLGGTSLMSLMLANVRDRVGEIGLRRALGARAREVAALFVIEACILTLSATVVGGLVAAALLAAAGDRLPVPFAHSADVYLVPVLASLLLGTIFSGIPARLAARISPAEALRNE